MDSSNQSIVFICGCMKLMNEGISCLSEPPKIEGGNEEDQRKCRGRRYHKSNSFFKSKTGHNPFLWQGMENWTKDCYPNNVLILE